jgi:hypothetical protein
MSIPGVRPERRDPHSVLDRVARWLPTADLERFHGWGVLGLRFASGRVLGLCRWLASSIGPPLARALNAVAARLPDRLLQADALQRVLSPVVGLLGAGPLALTGYMPNRQRFWMAPFRVWLVSGSNATLGVATWAFRRRDGSERGWVISASHTWTARHLRVS